MQLSEAVSFAEEIRETYAAFEGEVALPTTSSREAAVPASIAPARRDFLLMGIRD
jgi:hypothetical protein